MIGNRLLIAVAEIALPLLHHIPLQFDRDFVLHGQWSHRHAGHARGVFDQCGRNALGQHRHAIEDKARRLSVNKFDSRGFGWQTDRTVRPLSRRKKIAGQHPDPTPRKLGLTGRR